MVQLDQRAAGIAVATTGTAAAAEGAIVRVDLGFEYDFTSGPDVETGQQGTASIEANTNAPATLDDGNTGVYESGLSEISFSSPGISETFNDGGETVINATSNANNDQFTIDAFNEGSSFLLELSSDEFGSASLPLTSSDLTDAYMSGHLFDSQRVVFSNDANTAEGFLTSYTLTTLDSIPGDYSGDGVVDAADYTIWRDNVGSNNPAADGNGDGTVNSADYTVWSNNYGATASTSSTTFSLGQSSGETEALVGVPQNYGTAVPEPSGGLLMGLATSGYVLFHFFNRKR